MRALSAIGMIEPDDSGVKRSHRLTCSSDRKRFIPLQRSGQGLSDGSLSWTTAPSGLHNTTLPPRITTTMDSLQSGQLASILISLPGNNQHTASDSMPHWPNQFCSPSTLILYSLGWLESEQIVIMLSCSSSQPGYPLAIMSLKTGGALPGSRPSLASNSM